VTCAHEGVSLKTATADHKGLYLINTGTVLIPFRIFDFFLESFVRALCLAVMMQDFH